MFIRLVSTSVVFIKLASISLGALISVAATAASGGGTSPTSAAAITAAAITASMLFNIRPPVFA
jgi:hypothetical protein